jgi:uncharacterized protein
MNRDLKKETRGGRQASPGREECLSLMTELGMLDHIMKHCLQVAKVALLISNELNRRGQNLDLGVVEAASLLHDLTKAESLKTREDHAATAALVLKGMGYERVGEVIAEHVELSEGKDPFSISEEEVVNYADKRVRHDRIVSLEERFHDLKERYGKTPRAIQRLAHSEGTALKIEGKIFSVLDFRPEEVEGLSEISGIG